jgi:hypothetical protein
MQGENDLSNSWSLEEANRMDKWQVLIGSRKGMDLEFGFDEGTC